jgi:hypothetical protein
MTKSTVTCNWASSTTHHPEQPLPLAADALPIRPPTEHEQGHLGDLRVVEALKPVAPVIVVGRFDDAVA